MATIEERKPAGWVSFRLSEPEAEVLGVMARNLGVSKSAVVRAGIRALWSAPELFGTAGPITSSDAEGARSVGPPPPPPRKRGKRGKRR